MKPHIIVSSKDMEQLEQLLDFLPSSSAAIKTALLDELSRAEVLEPNEVPRSVVVMNSTVRFKIETSQEEFCKKLAYPQDMGDDQDKISILTPVGAALLGMSVSHFIEWPRPDGKTMRIEILDVVH